MIQAGADSQTELIRAIRLIETVGAELANTAWARQVRQERLECLPIPDEAAAERRSALGRAWRAQADAIDLAVLPDDIRLSVEVARRTADRFAFEAAWFWLVHDPAGTAFFGLFGPTSYCGGSFLTPLAQMIGREAFTRPGDCDRYLGLVADLADVVHAMRARLEGQASRGIIMPAPQLRQALPLVSGLAKQIREAVIGGPERYAHLPGSEAFRSRLNALVEGTLQPAFDALLNFIGGDYGSRASERVGIGQYPGGEEVYAELVRLHTTLDLTPESVHARGHERMREIREGMRAIRAEVGFAGDDAEYLRAIGADPRWRASSAEGVAAVFRRYIDRLAPRLGEWFHAGPPVPYDVAPLPEALQGSMTFGYYQTPMAKGAPGLYLFNAANLTQACLANIATLTYHELVPGHHLHLSSQTQNEDLAPLRKFSFFNAFNEGWAEYAGTLAGEQGLYVEPEERFGRLMNNAFLSCRLVVDTGMNVMGWSLEKGRAYMRDNSFISEREIATESIRYSCDIPAQSLAYKLGDTFLIAQRERMRAALGARFDLRDFHDAVLKPGALPLPLVAGQIDRAIARAALHS